MQKAILLLMLALGLPGSCALAAPANREGIGIVVNGQFIKPGDTVLLVWGAAGPPDEVKAMRGKEQGQDYVMFRYISGGFSIDVSSQTNRVQGILITDTRTKIKGVPVRLGESYRKAVDAWGQPDTEEPSVVVFWHKGVYLGIDGKGFINHIFLVEPGTTPVGT